MERLDTTSNDNGVHATTEDFNFDINDAEVMADETQRIDTDNNLIDNKTAHINFIVIGGGGKNIYDAAIGSIIKNDEIDVPFTTTYIDTNSATIRPGNNNIILGGNGSGGDRGRHINFLDDYYDELEAIFTMKNELNIIISGAGGGTSFALSGIAMLAKDLGVPTLVIMTDTLEPNRNGRNCIKTYDSFNHQLDLGSVTIHRTTMGDGKNYDTENKKIRNLLNVLLTMYSGAVSELDLNDLNNLFTDALLEKKYRNSLYELKMFANEKVDPKAIVTMEWVMRKADFLGEKETITGPISKQGYSIVPTTKYGKGIEKLTLGIVPGSFKADIEKLDKAIAVKDTEANNQEKGLNLNSSKTVVEEIVVAKPVARKKRSIRIIK